MAVSYEMERHQKMVFDRIESKYETTHEEPYALSKHYT